MRRATRSAYSEAAYRQAKLLLQRHEVGCWRGCGRRATSPDHVPALADHDHDPGSGCCELRPACYRCQLAAGAATGNRRRAAARAQQLAPGSDRR